MASEERLRYGRLMIAILSVLLIITGAVFLFRDTSDHKKNGSDVPWNDTDFRYFKQQQPQAVVVCWGRGDLNHDGAEETVIIYGLPRKNKLPDAVQNNEQIMLGSERWMMVVQKISGTYRLSGAVRAPVSNQTIEFKDIDNKLPMEVIISGSKGSNTGYAVYRLNDGKMVDLFGEGMDRCC